MTVTDANYYMGNSQLKSIKFKEKISANERTRRQVEATKCRNDVVYFAEEYFYIIAASGKQKIKLYRKQKEILRNLQNNNFNVICSSRQSGKSTIITIFFTWLAIFYKGESTLIAAQNMSTAKEIMSRVKLGIEMLPMWLKPRIDDGGWNKTEVKFVNKNFIKCVSSSSNGARGNTVKNLILDEAAFLPPNVEREFWNNVFPIISSFEGARVCMISTAYRMSGIFYKTFETARLDPDKTVQEWKATRIDWWEIDGRDERWKAKMISGLGSEEAFEQEFGNKFSSSGDSLIKAATLEHHKTFVSSGDWFEPEVYDLDKIPGYSFNYWFKPIPTRTYACGVDVADGVGKDESVVNIMDITDTSRMVQVATFCSNTISTLHFAYVVAKMCSMYNNAHISVEANGVGRALLDNLIAIYEYDNIVEYNESDGIMSHGLVKSNACRSTRAILDITNTDYGVVLYDKLFVAELEYMSLAKSSAKYPVYKGSPDHKFDSLNLTLFPFMLDGDELVLEEYYTVDTWANNKFGLRIPKKISNMEICESIDIDKKFEQRMGMLDDIETIVDDVDMFETYDYEVDLDDDVDINDTTSW
jgi:hypothetical protein